MRINGKITEIITSRALVSFGGFVELEGKEFEELQNQLLYDLVNVSNVVINIIFGRIILYY